jgi:hypothetical protein
MKAKSPWDRAAKKSISMPVKLLKFSERSAVEKGFSTFSDYLQWLIRKEMSCQR